MRIGTRGSELALWQARHVAQLLSKVPGAPPCELVTIHTQGDLLSDVPLSLVAGRAFFTREIETALQSGEIDLAVHSLKDLATAMPDGLEIAAILQREDPRDVLIARAGQDLDTLPPRARVGTSSLRRKALVARWRPDLELVDLRGNVPTRLERLDEGKYDAIVLAAAGLRRLGLETRVGAHLPIERFLPAVGQGALAVQVRSGDVQTLRWLGSLNDPSTHAATLAERTLLARLEGGCQIPLGALGEVDGGRLILRAIVCSLDGAVAIEGLADGDASDPTAVGEELADQLLQRGAGRILAAIRPPAAE